jgi:hypothetical protein
MTRIFSALLAAGLFSTSALAQVTVTDPWLRAPQAAPHTARPPLCPHAAHKKRPRGRP